MSEFDNDYTKYSYYLLETQFHIRNHPSFEWRVKELLMIKDLPHFKVSECNSFLENLLQEINDMKGKPRGEEWYKPRQLSIFEYHVKIEEVISKLFKDEELPLRRRMLKEMSEEIDFWDAITAWIYEPEIVDSTSDLKNCINCSIKLKTKDIDYFKNSEDRFVKGWFGGANLKDPIIKYCNKCERIYFNREDYEEVKKKGVHPFQAPFF